MLAIEMKVLAMINELLNRCLNHETLSEHDAELLMSEIMLGRLTDSQIASFITLLRFRGETVDELVGFARAMRNMAEPFPLQTERTIDTCGTGGDGLSTFNISTATAIVLASMNIPVTKHGNRSVSSKTGSADVFEALGIDIQSTVTEAAEKLKRQSLCFMFAPLYHPSMKHVMKTRKELGFRSIFNLLGPLTNPAGAQHQLLGVNSRSTADQIGQVLNRLGTAHSIVVSGADGLDECAIHGKTYLVDVKAGETHSYVIQPEDYGLKQGSLSAIQVHSSYESAQLINQILLNEAPSEAIDIVVFNAGVALYAGDYVDSIQAGVDRTKAALLTKQSFTYLTSIQNENRGIKHA
ncbi:anthranilate phosphoribosyltransferase [Alkalihalobacillus sp. LMS6]|nr:anthranilate phosphoribosyltransferase [Alkalihalobacillus sp. LMS6]UTR08385.1 anthranilate phosphoribosyltransferase [Alkalihalobacillus sp. LMS6]